MIRYLINTYHNFYPRSPYGERLDGSKSSIEEVSFLSTLSLRRATYWSCVPVVGRSFLSHALLTESDVLLFWACNIAPAISIHALLTESDRNTSRPMACRSYFYPRSPYGERLPAFSYSRPLTYFYPRSPYGERLQRPQAFRPSQHFYPRSPYGERPSCAASAGSRLRFLSTLSLRRATTDLVMCSSPASFLSTLSLRRATFKYGSRRSTSSIISIHALLTESD